MPAFVPRISEVWIFRMIVTIECREFPDYGKFTLCELRCRSVEDNGSGVENYDSRQRQIRRRRLYYSDLTAGEDFRAEL